MVENFLTITQQVGILFILIIVGHIATRAKILKENGIKVCTDIVLYLSTPCVIIKSFMREFDTSMLKQLGLSALAAVFVHGFAILAANLVFHDKNLSRKRVLRFGVAFSNAGFMCLPLQQAILGDIGVFFGATFVAIFNLFVWSYGVESMSNGQKALSVRRVVLNPGIISLLLGVLVFVLPISLPQIIVSPIEHLAALNTPIPMLIIGYYLANSNLIKAFKDIGSYLAILFRLIIIPLAVIGVLALFRADSELIISSAIVASAPVATMTTMFASKFEQDVELSVNLVALSTMLSMVTMPVIVALAQCI